MNAETLGLVGAAAGGVGLLCGWWWGRRHHPALPTPPSAPVVQPDAAPTAPVGPAPVPAPSHAGSAVHVVAEQLEIRHRDARAAEAERDDLLAERAALHKALQVAAETHATTVAAADATQARLGAELQTLRQQTATQRDELAAQQAQVATVTTQLADAQRTLDRRQRELTALQAQLREDVQTATDDEAQTQALTVQTEALADAQAALTHTQAKLVTERQRCVELEAEVASLLHLRTRVRRLGAELREAMAVIGAKRTADLQGQRIEAPQVLALAQLDDFVAAWSAQPGVAAAVVADATGMPLAGPGDRARRLAAWATSVQSGVGAATPWLASGLAFGTPELISLRDRFGTTLTLRQWHADDQPVLLAVLASADAAPSTDPAAMAPAVTLHLRPPRTIRTTAIAP